MSIDNAKAFLEKMKSDKEFRQRVLGKSDTEERSKMLEQDGFDYFDLSSEETKALMAEVKDEDALKVVRGHYRIGQSCNV